MTRRPLTHADVAVFASPSAYIRESQQTPGTTVCARGQIIVNVAKGVEENTLMPVCDIIKEEIPTGRCVRAFRTKPCGGGKPAACLPPAWSVPAGKGDGRISPGPFHEPGFPRVYNAGYAWAWSLAAP